MKIWIVVLIALVTIATSQNTKKKLPGLMDFDGYGMNGDSVVTLFEPPKNATTPPPTPPPTPTPAPRFKYVKETNTQVNYTREASRNRSFNRTFTSN